MAGGRFRPGADWDRIMEAAGVSKAVLPSLRLLSKTPIKGSSLSDVLARFSIPRLWEGNPVPLAESSLLHEDNDYPLRKLMQPVMDSMSKQWEEFLAPMKPLMRKWVPPNWSNAQKLPAMPKIEEMLLTEGIPVMWVPSTRPLQSIFKAPDASRRRRTVMRRWSEIADDCAAVLESVSCRALTQPVLFARNALDALHNGNSDASQALSANLIDTLLINDYGPSAETFKKRPNGTPPPDLEKIDLYRALTLAPIWAAYKRFWRDQGDAIPRSFGRHPSAHAVCRTQYSRTNATIAVMLTASLIRQLDHELRPQHTA